MLLEKVEGEAGPSGVAETNQPGIDPLAGRRSRERMPGRNGRRGWRRRCMIRW